MTHINVRCSKGFLGILPEAISLSHGRALICGWKFILILHKCPNMFSLQWALCIVPQPTFQPTNHPTYLLTYLSIRTLKGFWAIKGSPCIEQIKACDKKSCSNSSRIWHFNALTNHWFMVKSFGHDDSLPKTWNTPSNGLCHSNCGGCEVKSMAEIPPHVLPRFQVWIWLYLRRIPRPQGECCQKQFVSDKYWFLFNYELCS